MKGCDIPCVCVYVCVCVCVCVCVHRGVLGGWVASTLGATAEDRISGDPSRLSLVKWTMDDFQVG